MFSTQQKQEIADAVEKVLLSFNHPEMPKEKPIFRLRVEGAESWSWAEISPNWMFDENNPPAVNPFNEAMDTQTSRSVEEIELAIRGLLISDLTEKPAPDGETLMACEVLLWAAGKPSGFDTVWESIEKAEKVGALVLTPKGEDAYQGIMSKLGQR